MMDEAEQRQFDYDCACTAIKRWRCIVVTAVYRMEACRPPNQAAIAEAKEYLLSLAHEQAALSADDEDRVATVRQHYTKLTRLYRKLQTDSRSLPADAALRLAEFEKAQHILRKQLAVRDWWLWKERAEAVPDQTRISVWENERLLLNRSREVLNGGQNLMARQIISASEALGLETPARTEQIVHAGDQDQDIILT